MVFPQPFTTTPPLIASFDFFDFATGAGYKRFYLAGTKDDASSKYILTQDSSLISDDDNLKLLAGVDVDFDLTFNKPITIANALVTISYMIEFPGAGSSMEATWTLYHVRGGVETQLGTINDGGLSAAGATAKQSTVQFEVSEKRLNIGDKLRLNVVTTGGGGAVALFIDPAGTLTGTVTSRALNSSAVINIPFKLPE